MSNTGQLCRQLSRVLKAMADGSIDQQLGARLCAGMGVLRSAMESGEIAVEIARLEAKVIALAELANRRSNMKDVSNYVIDHIQTIAGTSQFKN